MLDIGDMLKEVYHAENAVLIPGSGSYAMEAVARHFATNKNVMVLRNGYFSFRWTDIFETTKCPKGHTVLKALNVEEGKIPHFAPHPIDSVVARILEEKPAAVF